MPISLAQFQNIAQRQLVGARNIVLTGQGEAAALTSRIAGRSLLVSQSARACNRETMAAFRSAMREQFGVFGEHAFEQVLGERAQRCQSLRARDVKAAISALTSVVATRLTAEVERQMSIHPHFCAGSSGLDEDERALILNKAKDLARLPNIRQQLAATNNEAELQELALVLLRSAKRQLGVEAAAPGAVAAGVGDAPAARPDQAVGLRRLQAAAAPDFVRGETSVEDRVRTGALGPGMRINAAAANPVLLEKIKSNGVEPGFLYRHDWSEHDTQSMMMDIETPAGRAAAEAEMDRLINLRAPTDPLRQLRDRYNQAAPQHQVLLGEENPGTRWTKSQFYELGLRLGREHPAGLSFAANWVIYSTLDENAPETPFAAAFRQLYPGLERDAIFDDPALLNEIRDRLFLPLQQTLVTFQKTGLRKSDLPVFRHYTDTHIAKLDYNESDHASRFRTGSAGSFRLPKRVISKNAGVGNVIKNTFYRTFRLTDAKSASVGAVAEAFANDLTRLAGIPAQELSIIEGQYSDGKPKLMLEAKFAQGYRDAEHYLHDGYIARTDAEGTLRAMSVPEMGAYKALFFLLGDRDAVGSHGQNKGIIGAEGNAPTFFAIDPGHSLEGNGPALEIHDDFSFRDTQAATFEKRFLNFSIFDDTLRSEKFRGILKLRELQQQNTLATLFANYAAAFPTNTNDPERNALNTAILARLTEMRTEAEGQLTRILDVFQPQLALFDALGGGARANLALDALENVEKLTSQTASTSPKGEVTLNHLRILPGTRTAWQATVQDGRLVFTTQAPVPRGQVAGLSQTLDRALTGANAVLNPAGHLTFSIDLATNALDILADEGVVREVKNQA